MRRLLGCVAMIAILTDAHEAHGQPAVSVPAWDSSVMAGLFLGRPREVAERESYDRWYHTGTLAITAGRYLSPHVKLEGELLLSGQGERFVQKLVEVPGVGPYPLGAEQMLRTNGGSVTLAWQFFDNQWVHPFVLAGAAIDFDRERVHTFQQSYYRGDPRIPGNEVLIATEHTDDLGTTRRLRGLLGGGAKIYITPRVFFRTDARGAITRARGGNLAFRLGFGVDF